MRLLFAAILWLGLAPPAAAGDLAALESEPPPPRLEGQARSSAARSQPAADSLLTRWQVNAVKVGLASAGTALLLWGALLQRRGRPHAHRRLRDGLLLVLGILGGLAWWNFLQFHFPRYIHPADSFHYYMGSKYFRELGYTRLYACTAIADLDLGRDFAAAGARIRNLETNLLEPAGPILERPSLCTRHFSKARWQDFRRDAAAFRSRLPPSLWRKLRTDHGYNGTPAWGILGTTLSNTGPATLRQLFALALLDPLLLLAMWGCVAWAFGWRTLCVALLFWGTNYPAQFGWTGGGFRRQDWLVATVVGICLLRRGRPTAGGFLLATAALLRVFPALILTGIALQALARMGRRRRLELSPSHRRILLGGLLAVAVLLPLSAAIAGGFRAWPEFARNSRVHLSTPLLNHMGLRTLLSYRHAARAELGLDGSLEDPYQRWKASRQQTFEERRLVFAALVVGFLVLLARAAEGQEDWIAAVLGIGMVPVAAELTGYYYGVLLGFGLLWVRREEIGAALCGLSALSWLFVEIWHWTDQILTWTSLAVVAFVVFATLSLRPRHQPR
jgi:hypothetical protein